ncbi:MAG: hypothetical protein PUP92_33710 [Rhizonema sp. PD38]|nr:hypothetical protein [Rhizonema sp. PD38]
MKNLTAFLKELRVRQTITVFLAGLLLIVGTTCGSQYAQAANLDNPAVQASPQINTKLLIAANNESELLYPGAETPQGRLVKEKELPIITEESAEQPKKGGLVQRDSGVGTRLQERVETVKEAVDKASDFLGK